ncbi:MAG TPA: hypothetical protein VL993_13045 [Stellaceae bacterium]|nr:hypothetical protein [Stellaceae bacterium]
MTVPSWVKPGFWGLVIGAFAWWGVLVWGFGWMNPATARQMADDQTQDAVVAVASPYCTSRFEQQANAVTSWQALKKAADNFDQDNYIEKGGYLDLPKTKPMSELADAVASDCARQLLALKQIGGVTLSSLK